MTALQSIEHVASPSTGGDEDRRHHLTALPRPRIRRAPRLLHGAVALGGLGLIIVAQLGLSITLSDGAYQISALQSSAADLSRTQQALQERVDVLSSPQQVATSAEDLGMVAGQASAFLRLSTGEVLGGPDALHMQQPSLDTRGNLLVGNELLGAERRSAAPVPAAPTEPEPYPGMLLPAEGVATATGD